MVPRLLSLCWLATALVQSAAAQTVNATNTTPSQLSSTQVGVIFKGADSSKVMDGNNGWTVWPLTERTVPAMNGKDISGVVVVASPSIVSSDLTENIVLLQCDPNAGSDPTNLLQNVLLGHPRSVILFSSNDNFCTFTPGSFTPTYDSLWTLTNRTQGQWITKSLQNATASSVVLGQLYQSSNNVNATSTSSSTSSNPSTPSTAVAMIILYSITGVITALFLIIIITGAIRAHRHPERYGPRNIMGRTRQSRARGLARAIVETLPIVKFGEQEPVKPGSGDVEMVTESSAARARYGEDGGLLETSRKSEEATVAAQEINAVPSPEPAEPTEEENPGCSICTDDFERGQDVRVLPCGHTFHPGCIDPWLLNVSGTCPLCRVDLRPSSVHSDRTTTSNFMNMANSESGSRRGSFAPPLTEEGRDRRASRFSLWGGILNPERMERASVQERIAALRRVRDERASIGEDDVDVRRRRRLTARFQDAFHIRTRARSSSRSRPASPEAERPASSVPEMPQLPPEVHSTDHISPVSPIEPIASEPPRLPQISPLQSPVSLSLPAGAPAPSLRHGYDNPSPATPTR